jgi:glycosyltransferase involved in cell wall biosynthesis
MDECIMAKRVLLISNVPQPYRIPLFNELNRQFKEKDIEFKVVFAAKGYKRRRFNLDFTEMEFNYEILKSPKINFGDIEKTFFTYAGINRLISRYKPDKIIVLGFSIATIKIWLRSFFHKIEYIIWSGAIDFPGRLDSFLRKFERKLLMSRASAYVAYGLKAKEYLVKMGAPTEKIYIAINTIDTKFFKDESVKIKSLLRKPEKTHFIYIGYLVPRKNVNKLIEVIEDVAQSRRDFVLDILGDGSERADLEKMTSKKKLSEIIKFHGFIQNANLPEFLAFSACFLFQTDFDVWGLVVNEAMAAGIPVLSSLNAGATYDLIINGKTGFIVDYNNKKDVVQKINTILDNPMHTESMGRNASELIEEKANIKISAKGFFDSVVCD